MRFTKAIERKDDPVDERISIEDCEPGQVYECMFNCLTKDHVQASKEPPLCNLRLCVKDHEAKKLFGLADGVLHCTQKTSMRGKMGRIYIHRGDITLFQEEKD